MIDLHSHLLPGLDDGSRSLPESLEMARIAVADGITISACTPHILPGRYENAGPAILAAVEALQAELAKADVPLLLTSGADVHITPNLVRGLQDGKVLPLGNSRYFLLEPPQSIVPPRFEEFLFALLAEGYVPIITHPERLSWIESNYPLVERAVRMGAWTQLTGHSLLGKFGRRARYWSERMLQEGIAHILASDAHNTRARAPRLAEAVEAAANIVGDEESRNLVVTRPAGILRNMNPSEIPMPQVVGTFDDRAQGR